MSEIDLKGLIEEVVVKFNRNRTGDKPIIFVTIPPELPNLFSQDARLAKLLRLFLYEVLLMNEPEAPVQLLVHRRSRLRDLEDFVGVSPQYWIQLRIAANGPCIPEKLIEERSREVDYHCEEWVGVEDSNAQLVILSPMDEHGQKMVFCVDTTKRVRKCDFLIPVTHPASFTVVSNEGRKF